MGKFHTSKKVLVLPPSIGAAYTFEELGTIVLGEIEKYRNTWTLKAIPYYDFDDAKMEICGHVNEKFNQWDQERSLFPWLHTMIRNQIFNIWRNKYWSFQKPCVRCKYHDPFTNWCGMFDKAPTTQCLDYKKWIESSKKDACDIKLPISINDDKAKDRVIVLTDNSFDIDKAVINFHDRMKEVLTRHQYKIYRLFYIEGKT